MKLIHILLRIVLCIGGSHVAYAETMRCGGDLIQEGDNVFTVLQKCGEPTMYIKERGRSGDIEVYRMIYKQIDGSVYYLHIDSDRVERIDVNIER